MPVLSTEVVPVLLERGGLSRAEVEELVVGYSEEEFQALQAFMIDLLVVEVEENRATVTEPETGRTPVLHSIISGEKVGGSKEKLLAFSFSNAASELLLPVCALIVAVILPAPWTIAQIVPAIGAFTALRKNIEVLKSPADDHAISIVRAIGVVRARHRSKYSDEQVSGKELQCETRMLDTPFHIALRQLVDRKIIKCVKWGGQSGDLSNHDNRWDIVL